MLQMAVYYNKDNSHFIQSIGRDGHTFATFDETKGTIDLTEFEKYIGEDMVVTYYKEQSDGQVALDRQINTVLTNVGVDGNGYHFVQYDGDGTQKIE